jgi:hypothetical protein
MRVTDAVFSIISGKCDETPATAVLHRIAQLAREVSVIERFHSFAVIIIGRLL